MQSCTDTVTVPTSDLNMCLATKFVGSQLCAAAFSLQARICTDVDPTLLYILIFRKHTKFVQKNKMIALGVCFSQPCSSDGRRFAMSRSSLNETRGPQNWFVSTRTNSEKCFVNWIPGNTTVVQTKPNPASSPAGAERLSQKRVETKGNEPINLFCFS